MNHACFNRTHFNMSRHARPGIIERLARAFGRWREAKGFPKRRGRND